MKNKFNQKLNLTGVLALLSAALLVGCKADVSPKIDNPFFSQDTAVVDPVAPIDMKLSTQSRVEFNAFKLTGLSSAERKVNYRVAKTSDTVWLSSQSFQTQGCDLADVTWSAKWVMRSQSGEVTSEVEARIGEGVVAKEQETLELEHTAKSSTNCAEARFSFIVDRAANENQ